MCYMGNLSLFLPDTSFVVGPGFKSNSKTYPGHPQNPEAHIPRGALGWSPDRANRLIELNLRGDGDGDVARSSHEEGKRIARDRLVPGRLVLHRGGARHRRRARHGPRAHRTRQVCAAPGRRIAPEFHSCPSRNRNRSCRISLDCPIRC
ncbi:hypothetical protein BC826DRAFT_144303 [Russula brevipes]|nr:hypothetical protein BC826DRAFT_144303 [Russula brevipes]